MPHPGQLFIHYLSLYSTKSTMCHKTHLSSQQNEQRLSSALGQRNQTSIWSDICRYKSSVCVFMSLYSHQALPLMFLCGYLLAQWHFWRDLPLTHCCFGSFWMSPVPLSYPDQRIPVSIVSFGRGDTLELWEPGIWSLSFDSQLLWLRHLELTFIVKFYVNPL